MDIRKAWELVKRASFVELGYVGADGLPNIRKTFQIWQYRSMTRQFISTNTSSGHVQALLAGAPACLYYSDEEAFEGLCLYGKAIVHQDEAYKKYFWNDGDEQYYSQGPTDPDYCIIEFRAERGRYYGDGEKHDFAMTDVDEAALGIAPFPLD